MNDDKKIINKKIGKKETGMQDEKGSATAQIDYLIEAPWLKKGILSNLVTFI